MARRSSSCSEEGARASSPVPGSASAAAAITSVSITSLTAAALWASVLNRLVDFIESQVCSQTDAQGPQLIDQRGAVDCRLLQNRQYLLLHRPPVAARAPSKYAQNGIWHIAERKRVTHLSLPVGKYAVKMSACQTIQIVGAGAANGESDVAAGTSRPHCESSERRRSLTRRTSVGGNRRASLGYRTPPTPTPLSPPIDPGIIGTTGK